MYEIHELTLFNYSTRMYFVIVYSLTLVLQDGKSSG